MKTNFDCKPPKALSLSFVILLLLAACFTSCTKDNNAGYVTASYLMVVNAADTSSAQDFYLDNTKVAAALAYGQNTNYTGEAGNRTASFRSAASGAINTQFNISFVPGNFYTLFYTDDKSTIGTLDDQTVPPTGKARVRFINLSPALSSSVDFDVSGTAIVSGLTYKTPSAYYNVDPAAALTLNAAGTSNILLSIPAIMQAGHIYTIYISGITQAAVAYHLIAEN